VSTELIDFTVERTRHSAFFGRQDALHEIDRLLHAGASWVLVTGSPGVGKSAILSHYLDRLESAEVSGPGLLRGLLAGLARRAPAPSPTNTDEALTNLARHLATRKSEGGAHNLVPQHFLRRGVADWARPARVTASLAAQVEVLFPSLRDPSATPEGRLIELLGRVSKRVLAPQNERLVLVIDGLDEAEEEVEGESLSRLLPRELPPGVSILCSSRPTYQGLSWLEACGPKHIDLDSPTWAGSNEAACREFWSSYASRLSLSPAFVDEAVRRSGGNMLYSTELLAWLDEQPKDKWRVEQLPVGLKNFLEVMWQQIARLADEQRRVAERGLTILCTAREDLTLSEIARRAGWSEGDSRDEFLEATRPFLLEVCAEGAPSTYRPFHASFRQFILDKMGLDDPAATTTRPAHPVLATGPISGRFAVLVGVDHYVEPDLELRYSVSDVVALGGTLQKLGYTVVSLHDDAPTAALKPTLFNVRAALASLEGKLQPNDLLLVHFSCHGTLVQDRPMLLASDSRTQDPEGSALPVDVVEAFMRKSGARRMVLLLDACHAGVSLTRGAGPPSGIDPQTLKNVYQLAEGFAMLAGSSSQQVAQEWQEKQHGVFTYFVLEGLVGAADRAQPPKGFVTVDDLNDYVVNGVRSWSVQTLASVQYPTALIAGVGDMILAEYAPRPQPPAPLPPPPRNAATSS
jgi:hypothetical protein